MKNINFQGTDKSLILWDSTNQTYKLKPNHSAKSFGTVINTNEFGLRKNTKSYNKDRPTWLLLGDSVTMGVGVDEDSTFASLLSLDYNNWNILNAGVVGHSTRDYLLHIKYLTKVLNIKKVSLFYCLNDTYEKHYSILDKSMITYFRNYFEKPLSIMRSKSILFLFLKNKLFDISEKHFNYDTKDYNENSIVLNNSINTILEIQKLLNDKEIQFEIFLLPYEYQLRNPSNKLITNPQMILTKRLKQFSIDTLDMYNYMIKNKANNSKSLYLYGDPMHFSSKGHQMVYSFIKSNSN